jgi:hypothetical protein
MTGHDDHGEATLIVTEEPRPDGSRKGTGKRIGRWTYFHHPYNGPVWRLDGTTLDLEHDPGCHSCCNGGRCNGAWVLYRNGRYDEPVAEYLAEAMAWVERVERRKAS